MWSPAGRGSISDERERALEEVESAPLRRSNMTSPHTHRGRVYRRCACRHAGKQLGARCPELTSNARHGTWTFAVDMPSLTGKRATLRRGGYATRKAATAALTRVLDCERSGIWLD